MASANHQEGKLKEVWPCALLTLTLGASLIVYVGHTQTVFEGWDPVAYLYAGQRIAEGKSFSFCHRYNSFIGPYFTLSGFNVQTRGQECLYLNYPPGFPLILAASQFLTNMQDAALYVPAVFGSLGVLVTFFLGKELFDSRVGALGALVLAFAPTFLTFSTSCWSDVPGTTLLLGGVTVLLWGQRRELEIWRILGGIIAGGMIGGSIFTRYANGIVLLPLALYLWSGQGIKVFYNKSLQVFCVCTVFIILGVLIFNNFYYGGFFTTPYSPEHGWYAWPAFSFRYIFGESPVGKRSLPAIGETFWKNFSWLLLPAAWAGVRLYRSRKLFLLEGSVFVFVVLYAAYAFPSRGVNARFLLPVFPFISILASYGLWNSELGISVKWQRGLGVAAIVVILLLPLPGYLRDLKRRNLRASSYVKSLAHLVQDTESNAVFLAYSANDPIAYYGKRTTLFYRRIPPPDLETGGYKTEVLEGRLVKAVNSLLGRGVPIYYVQDKDPPFWDSLAIMKRHFDVQCLNASTSLYRIWSIDRQR